MAMEVSLSLAGGTELAAPWTGTNGPDALDGTPATDRPQGPGDDDRLLGDTGDDSPRGGLGRTGSTGATVTTTSGPTTEGAMRSTTG